MSVAISRQTNDALARVMKFFGIDDYNRQLFSQACAAAGVEAFSKTIEALDGAIAVDCRNGVNLRIRNRITEQKEIDRLEKKKGRNHG